MNSMIQKSEMRNETMSPRKAHLKKKTNNNNIKAKVKYLKHTRKQCKEK